MNLPKYLFILFLIFLGTLPAQAQTTMLGYYVDSTGQRRTATFKFGFDQEDYKQFVVLSENQEKILTPELTEEVGFENGRLFQSVLLPEGSEKVFVLVMRDGEVDLLKWQKTYYLRKADETVILKEITSTKEVDGKEIKVTIKQYQGVLMSFLKVSPDQEALSKAIRMSSLNDKDLTGVIDRYHQENGIALDQELIQKQGSSFTTKLKVQAGMGMQGLIESFENQGVAYKLQSGLSPYVEAGVRFRDFRSAPRLFVDLGIAYYAESNEMLTEVSKISFDLEGKQAFSSSSFVIPLELHYIFAKRNTTEWYGGAGLSFWISSYENNEAKLILDNGEPALITHSEDFVSRKPGSVSPNLKLGWSKNLSPKSQLFIEVKGDLLLKNYEMTPLNYYAVYHLGVLTFSAGIAF